ncbi:NAD(P)-dependent dehydrogenase (short-subunit alcohol dehydrogenase family) [Bradyrhizobium liaoningense]
MGRLDGKVAVITGATSGIGLRTAEVFVAEGAKIVIAGRRVPEGEALAKQLGANCIFRQTDVTVEAQMQALIALAVDKFGRIDCLFNNAGGPAQTGGIEGLEAERFDAAMATLVRSVMLGMKHAAPYMKKQGAGSIINNGSIAGRLAGFSSSMVYSAAKAAVIHLTKCVAMELGESNVRVNSISPGAIATGIFGKALGLSTDASGEDAGGDARGLQDRAADPACRPSRRHRPGRGVPGQRRIQLRQRPRSRRRRCDHRRPQLEPAAAGLCGAAQGVRWGVADRSRAPDAARREVPRCRAGAHLSAAYPLAWVPARASRVRDTRG